MKRMWMCAVCALLLLSVTVACQGGSTEVVVTRVVTEVEEREIEVTRLVETVATGEALVEGLDGADEAKELEIFHWWTAGGEEEAAQAMFAAFSEKYPDVEIVANPVAGGGGVSQRTVLQARLSAGLPPDTWQTLGGAELKSYVDAGQLQPLDEFYRETGYADVIPGPLLNAVSVDGTPYAVPLNMHIQNILYYNQPLFDELGLAPPTTIEELLEVAETIRAERPGMVPMALGTREKWEAAFVFDSILLELGGPAYYVELYKGNIDVTSDDTFQEALALLAELRPYIYEFHSNLTWDKSVELVTNEEAAMVIMGTWAIGYFQNQNWVPGEDFNAVTFPQEPERILLFHPDTYGVAAGAPHPQAATNWLNAAASPELQIPTDVVQGGLFARTDIDPTEFPDPIRQELQGFVRDNPGNLILDQHGSIAPFEFTQAYWELLADFMSSEEPEQQLVAETVESVAELFTLHDVQGEASWYNWP